MKSNVMNEIFCARAPNETLREKRSRRYSGKTISFLFTDTKVFLLECLQMQTTSSHGAQKRCSYFKSLSNTNFRNVPIRQFRLIFNLNDGLNAAKSFSKLNQKYYCALSTCIIHQ